MLILPGLYQYTYPTFVDRPQGICVHFITPDRQQAFVSYPNHPDFKAAHLVSLTWFDRVVLIKLDGQPRLMNFLQIILPGWLDKPNAKPVMDELLVDRFSDCAIPGLLVA